MRKGWKLPSLQEDDGGRATEHWEINYRNLSEIIGVKTAIQHKGFFLELLAPKNKATKQQRAI